MEKTRRVVYTVLTGGYDRLQQPEVLAPGWDYICFTDGPVGQDGVWELRPIPYEGTPLMRARWTKLHPRELLPDYQYSVFMDANLCITGIEFYERAGRACPLAVLPHPERYCVYEELRYCYLKDKLSTRAAIRHHRWLREIRMPRHAGLFETNILLREHGNPDVERLDLGWWTALESCCPRDQLTFTPVLEGLDMTPELLFGPGRNARNVPFVRYTVHPPSGRENIPGRLNWANLKYNLRLLWRKLVLTCLK